MSALIQILETIRPGASWTLLGDDYSGLTWLDETQEKPTEDEVNAAMPDALTALANADIDNRRREQYQLRSDPLFLKWQRGESTKEAWVAEVNAIRSEIPG